MKKNHLLLLAFIFTISYLICRVGWTLPLESSVSVVFLSLILIFVELFSYLYTYYNLWSATQKNDLVAPTLASQDYPKVDIFVVVQDESLHKVQQTLNACLFMDYPFPEKIHLYLCDYSSQDGLEKLAHRFNITYFKADASITSKAQFLNQLLAISRSPYVVFFDGHTIPMHDYLMTTIPYFFLDDQTQPMGFVQTPTSHYNRDIFQFNLFSENNQPNEQDFYSQYMQFIRNQSNASLLGTTNTIISRRALESTDGFIQCKTGCEIATGIAITTNGYASYTLKKPHANSCIATDIHTFFSQKRQLAQSTILVLCHLKRYAKKHLPLKRHLAFLSSKYYWYFPLYSSILLILPILYSLLNIQFITNTPKAFCFFAIPHVLLFLICLKVLLGRYQTLGRNHMYNTIMALPLLPSFFSARFQKKIVGHSNKQTHLGYLLAYGILLVLSLYSLTLCFIRLFTAATLSRFILVFWLLINIYSLVMSLFFMLGRKSTRLNERLAIKLPVTLVGAGWTKEGTTHDLSEGGLSFQFDTPQYIPPTDLFTIILSDEHKRYFTHLQGEIVHVREEQGIWYYSVAFKNMKQDQADILYQILYDRKPTFRPKRSDMHTFFQEFKNNITRRQAPLKPSMRKLPRVKIKRKFCSLEGEVYFIEEFNYEYILVTSRKSNYCDTLILRDAEQMQITFQCTLEKLVYHKDSQKIVFGLYRLNNAKNYMSNNAFEQLLSTWADTAREDFDAQIKMQRAYRQTKHQTELKQ